MTGWLGLLFILPPHHPVLVNVMHASMQHSDTPAQQTSDAQRIFTRAARRDVWWVTGTEADNRANAHRYRTAARAHGYRFYRGNGDAWIAVDPAHVTGRVRVHWVTIIPGVKHVHPNRGVLRVTFRVRRVGLVSVLASHYNLRDQANVPIARELGHEARKWGARSRLVFAGVDTNMHLRFVDPFFGGPFTTGWADTHHFGWTHPGPETIDTVARYNRDGRPHAAYCRSLLDRVFPLATDHYPIEAGYTVQPLGA